MKCAFSSLPLFHNLKHASLSPPPCLSCYCLLVAQLCWVLEGMPHSMFRLIIHHSTSCWCPICCDGDRVAASRRFSSWHSTSSVFSFVVALAWLAKCSATLWFHWCYHIWVCMMSKTSLVHFLASFCSSRVSQSDTIPQTFSSFLNIPSLSVLLRLPWPGIVFCCLYSLFLRRTLEWHNLKKKKRKSMVCCLWLKQKCYALEV